MAENIDAILDKVEESDISSIRNVVVEILQVLNNTSAGAVHLTKIVECDPPLATRVLRRANSAMYGHGRSIVDIKEAIICTGFETVKELALTQKVCEVFEKSGQTYGYSRNQLWKHSLAVAVFCKLIYRREFRERGEQAFTAGLLHDLGLVIEDEFLREPFRCILREAQLNRRNLHELERETFGFTHADVGSRLFERWQLPGELIDVIRFHHDIENFNPAFVCLHRTLFVSNFSCQAVSFGFSDAAFTPPEQRDHCLQDLRMHQQSLDVIQEEVQKQIMIMEKDGWF